MSKAYPDPGATRNPGAGADIPALVTSLADTLAPLTVLDERGAAVTLGTLWRDRTAVVALVRHFG